MATDLKKIETVKVHLPSRRLHGVDSRVNESLSEKELPIVTPTQPPPVHNKISQKKGNRISKLEENRVIPTIQSDVNLQSTVNKTECHDETLNQTSNISDSKSGFSAKLLEEVSLPSSVVDCVQTEVKELEWRLKAERAKEEANEKTEIIEALKKKVAELHIIVNDELHEKLNERERTRLLKGDNEELKKRLEWHQRQLHECQVARDRFQKDLEKEKQRSQKLVFAEISALDCSIRGSHQTVPSIQLKEDDQKSQSVRTTERTLAENAQDQESLESPHKWAEEEKAIWEAMVAELEGQVNVWKEEAESSAALVEKGEKERAIWFGRIAELQQRLEEQVVELQKFKQKVKELEEKCAQEESRKKLAEREKEEARSALAAAHKEKSVLDGAVESIRDDFERVRKSFEILKLRLAQKEKRLAELEANLQAQKEGSPDVRLDGEKSGDSLEESNDVVEKVETQEDSLLEWESWYPDGKGGENQTDKHAASGDNEITENFPAEINESSSFAFAQPLLESQSSMLGASTCCLAAMERVDLEWREKHKTSISSLMRKMSQRLRKNKEVEREKCNAAELPTNTSQIRLSKPLMSFSLLPAPKKFDHSAIMDLVGEAENVIQKNNCSMATLKASLLSLGEEVSSLENEIKFTFLSSQKPRSIKTAD